VRFTSSTQREDVLLGEQVSPAPEVPRIPRDGHRTGPKGNTPHECGEAAGGHTSPLVAESVWGIELAPPQPSSAEELLERIRELFVPGGEPVGEPGRRASVRVLPGGIEAAQRFFDELRQLGEETETDAYSGLLVQFGEEGRVGLRSVSKSGEPTIDVGLQCVPEIRKIKFE
jgi:hypothetical protein